jgi:hypothetical protein
MSLATSVPPALVPAVTFNAPFCATGASLTGAMVTVTVATALSSEPSFTRKANVSVPLTFGFGV